jgi:formylglycine-generating enzyme required for sulfatase activity
VIATSIVAFASPAVFPADVATIRDCATCPELVVLGPGQFQIGARPEEAAALGLPADLAAREQPRRSVTIRHAFAFGRQEVTLREFAEFVADSGYAPPPGCWVYEGTDWHFDPERRWDQSRLDQAPDHPVTCVNWHDARAYVDWLSSRTGKPYRLPSEAEWEFAARSGTGTPYWFGSDRSAICRYVNLGDLDTEARFHWAARATKLRIQWSPEKCRDGFATTSPVRALPANAFGLYGVLGNVMEWVADCWHDDYSEGPQDQVARVESGNCEFRAMRGQGWVAQAGSARSAFRRKMSPADRRFTFGIRIARDWISTEYPRD